MASRRAFLGWSGLVAGGLVATRNSKPPKPNPHKPTTTTRPATTTTEAATTTTLEPTTTTTAEPTTTTGGVPGEGDLFVDLYGAAA